MSTEASPLVRWLARAVSSLFYRVECVGAVPPEGGVLILPNHANALLDPAIVWATAGRDVRFLAKSTLFEGSLRFVLEGAAAIPVYRRIDQGVDTSRNTETFAAVSAALAEGDAVCLFPEGLSHSKGRLEPLRTGAARMALDAERGGHAVALVPAGLNFDRKAVFRSRVTVVYGPPFSCRDLLPGAGAGQQDAVRTLTARIAEHIRRLIIEADPAADAALVERVERLYAAARGRPPDPADRLARRRTIAAGIEKLRSAAPERYGEILLRVRRYDQRLRRFGLRDRHLDWQVSAGQAVWFALREAALGLLLVPLSVAGLILFFVPYQVTRLASRRWPDDVIATAQVLSGAIVYGAWIAALAAAAWLFGGTAAALLTIVAIPIVAVASLFAIEREAAVLDAIRTWWLLQRSRHDTRERLRRRRTELADVLDEVQQWLVSAEASGTRQSSASGV